MIIGLLGVTVLVSLAVGTLAVLIFTRSVRRIIERIVPDRIGAAWVRYIVFATYVVGLVGGVDMRRIDRYLTPSEPEGQVLTLTRERWVMELYSAAMGSLGAVTWMLLVFFLFALVAYVVVRAVEARRPGAPPAPQAPPGV